MMEDSTLPTESHPTSHSEEDKTPQQQPASKRPREDPEDASEPVDDSSPQGKTSNSANPSAKMRRILSNREHARASYLRKKKLIEDLKKSVTTLEDENKRLREENIALKANRQYNSIGYGGLSGGLSGGLPGGLPQLAGAGHYSRMSAQSQSISQRRLALLESLTNGHSQSPSMLPQQALLGSLGSNRAWASEMAAGAGGSWPLNDRLTEEMMAGGGIGGGGGGGMSLPQQQQLQHRAALLEQYQNGGSLSQQQQQQLAMNHGAYGASLMNLERDETQVAQSRLPENFRRVSNN